MIQQEKSVNAITNGRKHLSVEKRNVNPCRDAATERIPYHLESGDSLDGESAVSVVVETEHTVKQVNSPSIRDSGASNATAFETNNRRHRCRIVFCTALFAIMMVSMGTTVIIMEGPLSESPREAPSSSPSVGPTQLFSQMPTNSGAVAGNNREESRPCFKAREIALDGEIISGVIDTQDFNATQRSFHRWCAVDSIDYPILFGPAVYYTFSGNGLWTTIRFCGDSRYMLNIYDSCTMGPRAYYDESCVVSVSTFAFACQTVSFNTLPDVDHFILVSTSENDTRNNNLGAYELSLTSNDSCERSSDIQIEGSTMALSAATPVLQGSFQGCDSASQSGAWYSVLGTGESFTFDTCQSISPGTQLTVYRGGCGESQQCVLTSEIGYACPEQVTVSWVSEPDERYYIHAYGSGGMFNLSVSRSKSFDLCEGAFALDAQKTQSYQGNTSDATFASDAPILLSAALACSNYNGSPGVWYSITGTNFINVDTCNDEGEGFEPQITVLQGSCDVLVCAELSVSKPCRSGSGTQILWNLVPSETYFLFLHGNNAKEMGSFNLTVTTF